MLLWQYSNIIYRNLNPWITNKMTDNDLTRLTDRLGALHFNLPTINPTREQMYRQTVLDAIDALVLFHLREKQMQSDVNELLTLRASSKSMKALIADLNQKLHGYASTTPIEPAGIQQRGVIGELPEA
jgi:hypothetical protein